MSRLLILIAALFLIYALPLPALAQGTHTFQCSYTGPADNPCIVSAQNMGCNNTPGIGSWEQQYCANFNNDMDACNASMYCCSEVASACTGSPYPTPPPGATPYPTNPPVPPTPTPHPGQCYGCLNNLNTFFCVSVPVDPNGVCPYYVNEGDCTLACANLPAQKFVCDCRYPSFNYCMISPSGTLTSNQCGDCLLGCLGSKSPIFCSDTGQPTFITTNRINTGLGCINYQGKATLQTLLDWAIGIAGGIGLLFIALAGIQIAFSFGDPNKIRAGKELLMAALLGLGLIILCLVILNFIGVTVLGLPHFNL